MNATDRHICKIVGKLNELPIDSISGNVYDTKPCKHRNGPYDTVILCSTVPRPMKGFQVYRTVEKSDITDAGDVL